MLSTTSKLCFRLEGGILTIRIDNPPINSISEPLQRELLSAVTQVQSDDGVDAIVITGASGFFASDIDIRDVGHERTFPHLPDVCNAIEASRWAPVWKLRWRPICE